MLTNLRIQNFKSLRDTEDLEIKPLTFFVGPNSSGKTSVFQFLLALKQTVESTDQRTPLLVQSRYVNLGTFKDIVWKHNNKLPLKIEFSMDLKFYELSSEIPELHKSNFVIDFNVRKGGKKEGTIYLSKLIYSSKTFKKRDVQKPLSSEPESIEEVYFDVFKKPRRGAYYLKILKPEEFKKGARGANRVSVSKFYRFLPEITRPVYIKKGSFNFEYYSFLVLNLIEMGDKTEYFFKKLFHLGPLREKPRRIYTSSGAEPESVGEGGEYIADVLWVNKKIRKDVDTWIEKFDIGLKFKLDELKRGSHIFEIKFEDINTKIPVNLIDVGFGVSQLLPIIVESILSPPDSVLLIEQPEIHLHPRAQTLIGEFFVEIAKKRNKNLIIETHSDLIISSVATSVAKGDIKPSDVVIYYFDPKPEGTNIKKITINEDGQYENFPKDFFEERFDEAMKKIDITLSR